MSEILVLGGGMVGIATALELQARGHAVTVVDRKPPGQETSYGNAGLIQAEAAEPYAMPRALPEILDIILGRSNDVVWSPRGVFSQLPALWQYYRYSHPRRHQVLSQPNAELIRSACPDHDRWISLAGAEDLMAQDGYLSVFQDAAEFDAMANDLDRLRQSYGIDTATLSGADLCKAEPLYQTPPAGAIHWREVWSCAAPGELVTRYAELFQRQGGAIRIGDASTLRRAGHAWEVQTDTEQVSGEHAVIALGPWTPPLLAQLGYRVRMIMKHGAHRMYPQAPTLRRPIFDARHGVVLCSMRGGLRMTCGVALEASGREPDARQLDRAAKGIPAYMALGAAEPGPIWRGTRPFLPDMLPMIGAAPRHDRLWFHFGHGHQGFTLGPTTARHLANLIDGGDKGPVAAFLPEHRPSVLR